MSGSRFWVQGLINQVNSRPSVLWAQGNAPSSRWLIFSSDLVRSIHSWSKTWRQLTSDLVKWAFISFTSCVSTNPVAGGRVIADKLDQHMNIFKCKCTHSCIINWGVRHLPLLDSLDNSLTPNYIFRLNQQSHSTSMRDRVQFNSIQFYLYSP